MTTFSDADLIEMDGGAKSILSDLARTNLNEKDKLHAEALEKVKANLGKDGDEYVARAVKAIIYKEVRDSKPELSALDRIAETLKAITKTNIKKALDQKDVVDDIVTHLKAKDENRQKRLAEKASETETTEKPTEKPAKESAKKAATEEAAGISDWNSIQFESSQVGSRSDYTESSETESLGSYSDSESSAISTDSTDSDARFE